MLTPLKPDPINAEPRLEITLSQLISTLSQLGIEVVGDVKPSVSPTRQSAPVKPDKDEDDHLPQSTPSSSRSNLRTTASQNHAVPSTPSSSRSERPPTLTYGVSSQNHATPVSVRRVAMGAWYTVTRGRDVGVFQGWHVVSPLVTGVSGSCCEKYPTEKDARAAFEQAVVHDLVTIV